MAAHVLGHPVELSLDFARISVFSRRPLAFAFRRPEPVWYARPVPADDPDSPGSLLWRHVATVVALQDGRDGGRGLLEVSRRVLAFGRDAAAAMNAYRDMIASGSPYATADAVADRLCEVIIAAMVAAASVSGTAVSAEDRMRRYLAARLSAMAAGDLS